MPIFLKVTQTPDTCVTPLGHWAAENEMERFFFFSLGHGPAQRGKGSTPMVRAWIEPWDGNFLGVRLEALANIITTDLSFSKC